MFCAFRARLEGPETFASCFGWSWSSFLQFSSTDFICQNGRIYTRRASSTFFGVYLHVYGLYALSVWFIFILVWFLGHEQVRTNGPVEESVAQSRSPAAHGVREETRCSTGHTQEQAFLINTAPTAAWGHPVLAPLKHCIAPGPPSLPLPRIELSGNGALWPYYG